MMALTERQPQLEKTKALRARAPLSRKAVAALCVTSFVAGLLLSGRVSLMSADASRDDGAKESVRASGCAGNKRKLGESHPKDLLNEVSRTHQAIQSLDKAVSTLEMELAVERARSGAAGAGTAVPSKPPQKAFVVIGINTAFSSRKRRDSLRETWVPRGSVHVHRPIPHAPPPPPAVADAPRRLRRGEAEEAGDGEGGRDPVRDRAQRRAGRRGAGPGAGRGGGRDPGLPAAGPRRGLPRAVLQDQDLLHHRRRHLGRRLLRQGRRRRPPQPRDAVEQAGEAQDAAEGVRRLHEVRACSLAKRSEVPRARVLEVRGRGQQVLPPRHRPDLRHLQGSCRLHLHQPADPAQVRERGRLARRVADRARGGARRRPEHVLRHASRLRVEEAGRERVRGVLRLVVQWRLQVGGQDAAHPQGLRRRRRGRLERRHMMIGLHSSHQNRRCLCGWIFTCLASNLGHYLA
ncbi:hypothetical protein SEVIR_5G405901v4 [Setaria viridis]